MNTYDISGRVIQLIDAGNVEGAIAVARNSALRVLPLALETIGTGNSGRKEENQFIAVFRNALIVSSLFFGSSHREQLLRISEAQREFSSTIIASLKDAAESARLRAEGADTRKAFSFAVSSAVQMTVFALDALHTATKITLEPRSRGNYRSVIEKSISAIEYRSHASTALGEARAIENLFITQTLKDIELAQDMEARLISMPLWDDSENIILEVWRDKEKYILRKDEQVWRVWTDWYDDRLNGVYPDRELELKKALIPNEFWEQGSEVLNMEIERVIAEHNAKKPGSTDSSVRQPPSAAPPRVQSPPFSREPHDYEPTSARLGTLVVEFTGSLSDDRVESEVSRFTLLLRRQLLDVTDWQGQPIVLNNSLQPDVVGVERIELRGGSVLETLAIILTCVGAPYAMIATYKPLKEGLAEVRRDVKAAIDRTYDAFEGSTLPNPPLKVKRREPTFRSDQKILDDLLDNDLQAARRRLVAPARDADAK